jgi:hypothetical protein
VAFYARVFCTAEAPPTIRTILDGVRVVGFPAEAPDETAKALDSPRWKEFEMVYRPDRASILVECQRETGKRSLCRETVREELNGIEDLNESEAKRRVADILRRTRFLVCCEVLGDNTVEALAELGPLLDYFVDHCGGLIDVEDRGFYARTGQPLLGRCVEDEGA